MSLSLVSTSCSKGRDINNTLDLNILRTLDNDNNDNISIKKEDLRLVINLVFRRRFVKDITLISQGAL